MEYQVFNEVMHSISCPVIVMRSYPSCTRGEPVTNTSLPLKIPFTAKFCSSCKLLYPIQLAAFLITLSSSILLICIARQIIMMGGNLTHDNSDCDFARILAKSLQNIAMSYQTFFFSPASYAHKQRLACKTRTTLGTLPTCR